MAIAYSDGARGPARRKGGHGAWEVLRDGEWVRERPGEVTLKQLEAWTAAKEAGGIAGAAEKLGVSYQSVYARVRAYMTTTGETPPFQFVPVSSGLPVGKPVAVAGHDPAKESTWTPVDRQAEAARILKERAERAAQRVAKPVATPAPPVVPAAQPAERPPRPQPAPAKTAPRAEVLDSWNRLHSVGAVARALDMDRSYVRRLLQEQGVDTSRKEPAADPEVIAEVAPEPNAAAPRQVPEATIEAYHDQVEDSAAAAATRPAVEEVAASPNPSIAPSLGPLLEPLLDWLVERGPALDEAARERWIGAFSANVRLVYPGIPRDNGGAS